MEHHKRKKRKTDEFNADMLFSELQSYSALSKMSDQIKSENNAQESKSVVEVEMYDSIVYNVSIIIDCKIEGFDSNLNDYVVQHVRQTFKPVKITHQNWLWCIHYKDNVKGESFKTTNFKGETVEEFKEKPFAIEMEYIRCLNFISDSQNSFDPLIVYKIYLAHDEYDTFRHLLSKCRPKKRSKLFLQFLLSESFSFEQYIHIGYKTAKLIIDLGNNPSDVYISKVFWLILGKLGEFESFDAFDHILKLQELALSGIKENTAITKGLTLLHVSFLLLNLGIQRPQFSNEIEFQISEWHRVITHLMNQYASEEKFLRYSHLVLNHLLDHIIRKNTKMLEI